LVPKENVRISVPCAARNSIVGQLGVARMAGQREEAGRRITNRTTGENGVSAKAALPAAGTSDQCDLRIRLLGPITADRASVPLRLGGPKPVTVLAALLLDAGAWSPTSG
jgi:hypothetical protein